MILLDDWIAERGLDAPHAEHETRLDSEIAFDVGKQLRVLLRLLPAGCDLPVRSCAIEILPELDGKFGPGAADFKTGRVGLYRAHDARVDLIRDAVRERLGAKRGDPLIERRAGAYRACLSRQHQSSKRAGDGL